MLNIVCDRCGSSFKLEDSKSQTLRISIGTPILYYDLCNDCYKRFRTFLDEGKFLPSKEHTRERGLI